MSQDQERNYYLPPKHSGLERQWTGDGTSQAKYVDFCQRGHDLIANQIVEGRKSGTIPSLKELYRTAARVRRAIAVLNQSNSPGYLLYGHPPMSTQEGRQYESMIDTISAINKRYWNHCGAAQRAFDHILQIVRQGKIRTEFAGEYIAEALDLGSTTTINIFRNGIRVSSLSREIGPTGMSMGDMRRECQIRLVHADIADCEALLENADKHFQHIHKHSLDAKKFWQEMAEISLDLFHATPLRLGSQTATLMVLAGITKAMGYEVVPRILETDHFMEADMTPYQRYVEAYEGKFIHPPGRTVLPQKATAVDDDFLKEAREKLRQRYSPIAPPLERLTKYIEDLNDNNGLWNRMEITGLTVEGAQITSLSVNPSACQREIVQGLNFIGHDEIIDILELPQGRITAPPQNKDRPQTRTV